MNYYERHIGDYLKDTSHLSLLEHGVYCRLMDVYYTREAGLPQQDVARLVGARSREEKAALESVLREFFTLDEGSGCYVQERCEREIARFRDKQAKARRSADARWSAQRAESERNANASPNAMRTHSEGNAPRARPQTPDTKPKNKEAAHSDVTIPGLDTPERAACPVEEPPDPEPPPAQAPPALDGAQRRCVDIALLLRAQAVDATAHHPTVLGWVEVGASDDVLQAAVARARERKPAGKLPLGYLDPIVRELLAPPAPRRAAKAVEWWSSDSATLQKAAELGIAARAGEDWQALRGRIRTAIEQQEARA